jgi:prepilin-type N-terminal cleavage/methylation domain-containing protein
MIKNLLKQVHGFTLIELLVVIAIIGILAATISVNYSSAQKTTRDNKRQIDMDNTAAALTLYYSEKKEYPKVADWDAMAKALRSGGYMTTVPLDPKNNETYKYKYWSDADGSMFTVYTQFETKHNSTPTLNSVNTLPPWDSTNISLGNGIFKYGGNDYYRSVGR